MRGETIQITLKVGHHRPASKTQFKWHFASMPMMAWWFYRGSGPVLLRNPLFLWFFRGGQDPCPHLWIRTCYGHMDMLAKLLSSHSLNQQFIILCVHLFWYDVSGILHCAYQGVISKNFQLMMYFSPWLANSADGNWSGSSLYLSSILNNNEINFPW